jgi:hypothetical protein
MWMVNPRGMCRKHLLGEHVETHMTAGAIRLGHNLQGYYDNNLIDPASIRQRHDELSREMVARGYRHNSPIEVSSNFHVDGEK